MEKVLYNVLKQQIQELKEVLFQYFIDELYLKCYGNEFVPIKPKRDKGNDGLLRNSIILAVYAPKLYTLKTFKRKVEEDFNSYKENFSHKYPGWQVIFNGEWTSEMVDFVKTLKDDSQIIGIKNIMELLKNLRWSQLKEIADYLNVDDQYFINDILARVVDDLIKEGGKTNIDTGANPPPKATYIEEKIELNYSEEDIEDALEEYEDFVVYFTRVKNIITPYKDEEKSVLKSKIKTDYKRNRGMHTDFKNTLAHLAEDYSQRYKNDDLYKFYVRVVLIYLFEQCIIGKKTGEEKNAGATS